MLATVAWLAAPRRPVPASEPWGAIGIDALAMPTFALIAGCAFAMAQQDIRFYLNGMLFVLEKDQLVCVATDGHRLSYAVMPVEGNFTKQEIIVPRKTVIELSKLLSETDDPITIDIPNRRINLDVANDVLDERRISQEKRDKPYTPLNRDRVVSAALRAYASMATAASDGAYRRVPE